MVRSASNWNEIDFDLSLRKIVFVDTSDLIARRSRKMVRTQTIAQRKPDARNINFSKEIIFSNILALHIHISYDGKYFSFRIFAKCRMPCSMHLLELLKFYINVADCKKLNYCCGPRTCILSILLQATNTNTIYLKV